MVSAPPAPPPFRVSQRLRYRELLGLVAIQSFGNQMAGSFWIVYLVSEPQALAFDVAALLWVVAYLTAAVVVVGMSRGRPIHARSSMTLALMIMAFCHFAFAVLPASWILVVGGVAFGLYLPLFWLPLNCLLVRETSPPNPAGPLPRPSVRSSARRIRWPSGSCSRFPLWPLASPPSSWGAPRIACEPARPSCCWARFSRCPPASSRSRFEISEPSRSRSGGSR